MIVKLNNELALFTAWSSERERFKPTSVREASKEEAELALNAISPNEISTSPGGFRDLAIALLSRTWVGEIDQEPPSMLEPRT